jgi:hypothetical protein
MVDIHTRTTNKVRHIIMMKVRTSLSIYNICTTIGVIRQLKEMQAYIQEHHFTIDKWDISSVGWFHNLHPSQMSYDAIVTHSNSLMAAVIKTFLLPQSNSTSSSSKGIPKIHPIYVPWTAQPTTLTWYQNCMRAQRKYLCNTWTLPVTGVPRSEMWYFEPKIGETGLGMSVHPHCQTDTTGGWNLLVHKTTLEQPAS